MKNFFSFSNDTNKKNQNSKFDFAQAGLSRNQLAALKGGEDTTDEDIIITDIIGG